MSCSCHGKSGISVTRTSPFDQCTSCAKKHIIKAWSCFNEFTYTDDNRDYIVGQLRSAVDHLMFDHKDIALLARDLSIILEEARDTEITSEWSILRQKINEAFYNEHPDVRDRLNAMVEKAKNK